MKLIAIIISFCTINLFCSSQTAETYYVLGKIKYDKKDYKGAIEDFSFAVKLNPNSSEYYYYLGCAKEKMDDPSAELDFNKSFHIDNNNTKAYNKLGLIYSKYFDHAYYTDYFYSNLSLSYFDLALEKDTTFVEAYCNRGILGNKIANSTNDYSYAIKDFEKAINLSPRYAEAYNGLGYAKMRINDFDGALSDLNKAIALAPSFSEAYYNRGLLMDFTKKYFKAIEDYSKCILLDPNNYQAYYNRALLYLLLDNKDKGCSDLKQASKLSDEQHRAFFSDLVHSDFLRLTAKCQD